MPAPYGVTPTGFSAMTVDEAQQALESDFQGAFGAGIDVGSKSNLGQFIGIAAERLADVYAMGQDTYNAATPDGAAGAAQDFVNGLRGVPRLAASPSTAIVTLLGAPSTALTLGRIVATPGVGTQFKTTVAATLPSGILAAGPPQVPPAWASSTPYAQGAVIATNGHLYLCTIGGTSGTVSGPAGYGAAIIDNTATWAYAGEAVTTWDTLRGTAYTAPNQATGQGGQRVNVGGAPGNVYLCATAGGGASTMQPGAVAWVSGTTYVANAQVTYGGQQWYCSGAGGGTSTVAPHGGGAGADGYTWVALTADGYSWTLLGQGLVAVDVPCQSVLTGPQAAGAGSLTVINTPVNGWTGAYNVQAAVAGENPEADDGGVPGPGYRLRAEQEIRAGGAGYVQAIQEAVLAALIAFDESNAQATVVVYENATSLADSAGRPPNSLEVAVNAPTEATNAPGTNAAIGNAIFLSKPAGIQLVSKGGTQETVTVLDSEGNQHSVVFSIVSSQRCYAALTVHIDATVITEGGTYPNTKAAVAAILSTWVTGLGAGRNLPAGALGASAFGLNLPGQRPGILDVTAVTADTVTPPVAAYATIDSWHYAALAATDITVTVVVDDH